jgi:PEP-CTERM motif
LFKTWEEIPMKSFVAGLIAAGAVFAAMQPAQAAFVLICPSTDCGSAIGTTTFTAGDFEAGFDVNGSQVTIGLGNSASPSVPQAGSFVDGAAKNTFSGSWIDNGASTPVSATVFFTDPSGAISDVLSYTFAPSSGGNGSVSGFMISGILSAADLAGVGITPTATAPEGQLFVFDNAFIEAHVLGAAVPEPSTWALMLLGFAGLGYAGWRQNAKAGPALT